MDGTTEKRLKGFHRDRFQHNYAIYQRANSVLTTAGGRKAAKPDLLLQVIDKHLQSGAIEFFLIAAS